MSPTQEVTTMPVTDETPTPPVVVNQTNFDTEALAPAVNEVIRESRKGWKTTEFWVAVVVSLLTWLDTIPLPEKFEGVVIGAIALAYALSRGLAKQGIPDIAPGPSAPTA